METSTINQQAPASSLRKRFDALAITATVFALTLWGISLALPVWETRSDTGEWKAVEGILPALIGWLGVLAWCPAWFANLLLIPSIITLFARRAGGFWLSVAAFVIAATAYMMPAIYGDNNEDVIVGRKIGFYVWLASFLIVVLGNALQANRADRSLSRIRFVTVLIILLLPFVLERAFRVGVSPLEATLKNPDDAMAFTTVLSRNPPQAEKDAALHWVMLTDVTSPHRSGAVRTERLRQLIAAGANVNQSDRYGQTPLMEAAKKRGAEPVVRMLISAGANVNARNRSGRTVLDIAEEYNSGPECERILVDAGAVKSEPTHRN